MAVDSNRGLIRPVLRLKRLTIIVRDTHNKDELMDVLQSCPVAGGEDPKEVTVDTTGVCGPNYTMCVCVWFWCVHV